jgi:hypothetical protein
MTEGAPRVEESAAQEQGATAQEQRPEVVPVEEAEPQVAEPQVSLQETQAPLMETMEASAMNLSAQLPTEMASFTNTDDHASAPSGSSTQVAGQISMEQLPPELIDAIARRVVEQMSERVVQEIAWEVVPQLAELLIMRRLEENSSQ